MSRGFVREGDQEEPPFIPPRAPLPDGVPNHVTARGLRLLHEERAALEAGRAGPFESEEARRRAWAEIDGRLGPLNERIATAHMVERPDPVPDDVRFGATISFALVGGPNDGQERVLTIVGVDEASVKEGRIAFTAPVARALLGRRQGDEVEYAVGTGAQRVRVLAVRYA